MGNGLILADNSADIEFTDGVDVYGFKFANGMTLVETRGDAYSGQISSGGQTYDDAEPFKRKVYDNFLGGFGQLNDNKVYGGVGLGGDDTKYFYGDATTDRGGYLLPGAARNLVYNTIAGQMVPVTGGVNPVAGDEWEVPRGLLPLPEYAFAQSAGFAVTSNVTITNIRLLLYVLPVNFPAGTYNLSLYENGVFVANYTVNVLSTYLNYTGWKWVNLVGTWNFTTGKTYNIISNINTFAAGYAQTDSGITNKFQPYFQLCKPSSTTPYKQWSNPLVKIEHINDGAGAYANVAMLAGSMFNTATTGVAGSAGTSPEKNYPSGSYQGSIWFNSLLYVFLSTGCAAYNYAAATTNGTTTPTVAINAAILGRSPVEVGGKIYFVSNNRLGIYSWDTVSGTATQIVADNTIGLKDSPINKLFMFQGNLWALKPEGLFQLYIDPAIITTAPGTTPRILPIVTDLPSIHPDTGRWFCIHQGMIFFNYRDRIYQVVLGQGGPPQVMPLVLPMPWYRLSYYNYVNGISSDGVSLYVSYNNLGVFKWVNQVWHPVCEFYEQVATEGQFSGLRWVPNPTGAPDYLFVGDGRTIVQLPMASAAKPYTQQLYANHQNKCGYLITSATDMEQAEITKFVQSVVLRVVPSGFSYMVRPVAYVPGSTASFQGLLNYAFWDGMSRDNWVKPTGITSTLTAPAVTQLDNAAVPIANTLAPTSWVASDFSNLFYSSEKIAQATTNTVTGATDVLTNPPKFAQTAFILYFWNPTAGQHATTGQDLMAVDSIVVKYQATQNLIALYQVTIDFTATGSGKGAKTLTPQQIEDSYDWLRSQSGRHSPLQATFKVRNTGTKTRTIYFFPQNPNWISKPTISKADEGDTLIETVGLQMLSTQGEYPNV